MEMAGAALGGVAATGTFAATELGKYNRENYMHDSEFRFQRFTASRGFANSQTAQYREDCRGMTELTAAKGDMIYTVSTLFMCVCAALSCAGRLGMHGAAPPEYLCALYSGHIATSIMFLSVGMILALHSSQRAHAGNVSLLTRKVRLPIPSMKQLDQARNFGSAFERQKWTDIFRVPFAPHPNAAPQLPEDSSGDSDSGGASDKLIKKSERKNKARKLANRSKFGSTKRNSVPTWIRDEQVLDKGGGLTGGSVNKHPHDVPEHFRLYAGAQMEWWPYEIYSRICMLFGVLQFLFAITYYCIGTAMSELRGFWIVWSIPAVFITAAALILRLDILSGNGQQTLPHLEWAGILAPYLAVTALTLDYRWTYTPEAVTIAWGFAFAALFGHFLFALRMLDLAWPYQYREEDMEDEPGKSWFPAWWKVPPAFTKSLWLMSPPKKLEPGQHCLLNEMNALQGGGGGIKSETCRRRKGKVGSEGGRTVSLQTLKEEVKRLDGRVSYWTESSVFSQLLEKDQRRVKELKNEVKTCSRQVQSLSTGSQPSKSKSSKGSSSRDADFDSRVDIVSDQIAQIDDGLMQLDASAEIVRNGHGSDGTAGAHRSPNGENGKSAPDLPWQVTRVAILGTAFCWFYMIVGTGIEVLIMPESIIRPPGMPPWIRDQKQRQWNPSFIHHSTDKSFPEGYRLFSPVVANYEFSSDLEHIWHHQPINSHTSKNGEAGAGAAHHRRLTDDAVDNVSYNGGRAAVALNDLLKTLPALGWLAAAVERRDVEDAAWGPIEVESSVIAQPSPFLPAAPRSRFMAPAPRVVPVSWPSFFEPRHMACTVQDDVPSVVTLTSRGLGFLLKFNLVIGKTASATAAEVTSVEPFTLHGIDDFGPLAGASSTTDRGELRVVTKRGIVLRCTVPSGNGPSDVWPCKEEGVPQLPLQQGARLMTATVIDHGHLSSSPGVHGFLAAVSVEDSPDTIALFEYSGEDVSEWIPAGDVHLPPSSFGGGNSFRPSGLSFDGADLIAVAGATGEVHRRQALIKAGQRGFGTGFKHHAAPPSVGDVAPAEWRSACTLQTGQSIYSAEGGPLLRLSLRQSTTELGSAMVPEITLALP